MNWNLSWSGQPSYQPPAHQGIPLWEWMRANAARQQPAPPMNWPQGQPWPPQNPPWEGGESWQTFVPPEVPNAAGAYGGAGVNQGQGPAPMVDWVRRLAQAVSGRDPRIQYDAPIGPPWQQSEPLPPGTPTAVDTAPPPPPAPPAATESAPATQQIDVQAMLQNITGGAGVPAAGGSGGRYPTLSDVPPPNYDRVLQMLQEARPRDHQPMDDKTLWRMALLGALANASFQPGEGVGPGLLRSAAGGAGTAFNLLSQDQQQRRLTEREQREHSRDVARTYGSLESDRFRNSIAARTFDRDSAIAQDNLSLSRQRLAVASQNAGLNRLLTMARINNLTQQAAATRDPNFLIASLAPLIGRGDLATNFRIPYGANGQEMSVNEIRDQLRTGMLRSNPILAANPQEMTRALNQAVAETVSNYLYQQAQQNPEIVQRLLQIYAPAVRTRRSDREVQVTPFGVDE